MIHEKLTYAINGCLFAVYNALGNVWPEDVYERALLLEFRRKGLQVERQQSFEVFYFDTSLGTYRLDLLVKNTVIVELKAAPQLTPLHRAQLLSYLKGCDKPLGILANFGGSRAEHETMPKNDTLSDALTDRFDYESLALPQKEAIKDLLLIANRVLVTLGPGYLAQIYRRALYHELKTAGCKFETVKEVSAHYRQQPVGTREVNFFVIGDLLLSAVTVKELHDLMLLRFRNYLKHLHCRRGLIINFHATVLDFRYIELKENYED